MPRQTEPNANNALGDLLRSMMLGCEVRSENTQTFRDHPGRHADVLIAAPGTAPASRLSAQLRPRANASELLGSTEAVRPGRCDIAPGGMRPATTAARRTALSRRARLGLAVPRITNREPAELLPAATDEEVDAMRRAADPDYDKWRERNPTKF